MTTAETQPKWCFRVGGEAMGPLSTEHLQAMLLAGRILPGHPVWRQTGSDQTFVRAERAVLEVRTAAKADCTLPITMKAYQKLVASLEVKIQQKDRFFAVLSHELRNPLTPILMSIQTMRIAPVDHPIQAESRDVIERQVKKLVRLVDDLLDVARLNNGKIAISKENVDFCILIERSIDSSRGLIDGHKHQFQLSIPEQPVRVNADAMRMEQVIVNLLANAAKYTPDGGIITLTLKHEGDRAVLSIRDTGIGIAPEMKDQIFDLFTQSEAAREYSEGGLGVGLALVKAMVELHGGSVEVHSEGINQGCEFVVRLPVTAETASNVSRKCRILVPAAAEP